MHGNDSLEFRLNNMAFNQDICACMWVCDESRFKLKQALWRWFSEDFVCMNGAGLCTPPRFCTAWPLAWPLEDNLQQHQLPCLALLSLIIFSMLPLQCGRKWLDSTDGSGVRRRRVKMQVRSALQLCSASVLREFTAMKPVELWALRLSVKRWPTVLTGLGIRKARQPALMDWTVASEL